MYSAFPPDLATQQATLFHDLDAEALECNNPARVICQQADGVQAEIRKDLGADSNFMLRGRVGEITVMAEAAVMSDDLAMLRMQAESCLVQIYEYTGALFDDPFERAAHHLLTIAADRPEQVAVGAMRVHANEHVLTIRHLAVNQSHVRLRADLTRIEDGAEVAELGCNAAFGAPMDVVFMTQPVADQVGDRNHLQDPWRAQNSRSCGTRAMVPSFVHDFGR